MQRNLIMRHYVDGPGTYRGLERGIAEVWDASDVCGDRGIDINLGLKLTVNEKKLTEKGRAEYIGRAKKLVSSLPTGTLSLYDSQDRGPGTSFLQILFNSTYLTESQLVASADLDQYRIRDEEALRKIGELFDSVERRNFLMGVGMRDVPIALARHQENSRLREVQELVHTFAMRELASEAMGTVTGFPIPKEANQAFAEYGECGSGFYVMNTGHALFPRLVGNVAEACQQAKLTGFAADFFTALRVAELTPPKGVFNSYVRTKENVFEGEKDFSQEKREILDMIRREANTLGKTGVKPLLEIILDSENTEHFKERLEEHYDSERIVEPVFRLMRSGLVA